MKGALIKTQGFLNQVSTLVRAHSNPKPRPKPMSPTWRLSAVGDAMAASAGDDERLMQESFGLLL